MSCEKECKLGKKYCCMECPSYDICREKRKNRKSSFEKAVKWIAVSIAVIAGIKMTGSAWCLWAFALPVSRAYLVKGYRREGGAVTGYYRGRCEKRRCDR